ncbi:hypothetical protein GOP47_0005074 [Adiantum capillus-veneris]|uniref:TrmE-type G domain-containing protein n=1 Tax=Adiantum capillus-veneris TaxID=13818 RepID=A0A9D4V525_ADICA|nr:hypothetical protein GOP47_0005074 [Adiantum capillus-veneris]
MACRAWEIPMFARSLPGVRLWWHRRKSCLNKICCVQLPCGRRTYMWRPVAAFCASSHDGTLLQTSVSFSDARTRLEDDRRISRNMRSDLSDTSDDTIVAIVTPVGGQHGAVEIIRLSGPSAVAIVKTLFVPSRRKKKYGKLRTEWSPVSHMVEYGTVIDASGALVDEVLVVPMLTPRSYTREDVIEIQCHGGGICSRRVLHLCLEAGARLAQPGEFTLRAFLNGRLDLSQAENVAQLVSAKTISAAETALAGLQGGLSVLVRSLRAECIEMLADVDARLDFDDELPDLNANLLIQKIEKIWQQVQQALKTEKRGKLLQIGIQVAIVGRPNVGKSSLLNAWSQTDRAIVTNVAGTTRDIVEAGIVVGGFPVKLLDTAGIRETHDVVESIGVERSVVAAKGADVIVMVVNAQDGWTQDDTHIFDKLLRVRDTCSGLASSILVINKIDQAPTNSVTRTEFVKAFDKVVPTCALQRLGFDDLEAALLDLVGTGDVTSVGQMWAVNQRQAEQLLRASEALERLKGSIQQCLPIDFWAVDIKEAAIAFGEISGDVVSEEVLSRIFSKFCIGK